MAEARSEEEEDNMRETREQVVRRPPNRERPDRRKPEQRHSQGPLSSIRAVIKRTSNRSSSVSETTRDRDRERDRRRPEITILSAEPLPSTSWFPGASAGIPPPPPPAAQIWGATIPPDVQPPPSYEEVIKEKTQEQVSPPSLPSCSSSAHRVSTITIATQTDPGTDPDRLDSQVGRPLRPSRPPLPCPPRSSHVDDSISTTSESTPASSNSSNVVPDTVIETVPNPSDPSPLTSTTCAQTDQLAPGYVAAPSTTSSEVVLERPRPRPRPRSKLGIQPVTNEVKVQTLVKLREDGLATLAARASGGTTNQDANQGKYLHELLEAFSSDDWGFPEQHSDGSENSQSESEEDEEDMATLKARIQAFEQQQQQPVADGSSDKDLAVTKRPEPRPRPRLHPATSTPPSIAPKPKTFSHAPKPSSQVFWDDGGLTTQSGVAEALKPTEATSTGVDPAVEASPPSAQVSEPSKPTEKPPVAPKPQSVETTPPSSSAPVPAPRPPPPKLSPSPSTANPKPPPRPTVAPRVSVGSPQADKSTAAEPTTPTLPPRPSVEATSGSNEVQDKATGAVKPGSVRPVILNKPTVLLSSPRRASAPALTPKPTGASNVPPDLNSVPNKPAAVPQVTASRPSGPVVGITPATPAGPAPALRKDPVVQSNPVNSTEPPLPPRPSSGKFLPLRPPPIKSIPERPPPPVINSASSQFRPPSKGSPPPPSSPATQPSQTRSSPPLSATQNQRAPKKGPPLPPRPKPGHPLYNSYSKQEVLIVLDDSEQTSEEIKSQTGVAPLISQSQCLLDLDIQPVALPSTDSQSKPALEDLSLSDSQSILPVDSTEQKEQPDRPTVSGPRCVALFDYEGEEDDELTFSQGDVIALLEHIGDEWGRGEIHGRIGIFPLNFTKVVEALPQPESSPEETSAGTELTGRTAPKTDEQPVSEAEEWVVALFDFTGQTAEDLSFHKGALIHVLEHVDAEWRKGRLEGREGLYPAAFTQPCQVEPVPGQQPLGTAKALFDFTAENEDELTLKVGDIITQVEPMDEQWILGVVGGRHGIIPKNYISLL